MKRKYGIALAICALAWGGFWMWTRQTAPDPAGLATRALTAADVKDRANAAVELCGLQENEAIGSIRRVARESQDAEVLVPVLTGLAARLDGESTKFCLERLDHSSEIVREAAILGLVRLASIPADEVDFKSNAPEKERKAAADRLRKLHAPLDHDASAAIMKASSAASALTPVENPNTKKETTKETLTPSLAPMPAPQSVPLPPPSDYPAIALLVWMCRVLAVLVLIAEVAGAISLFVGEKDLHATAKEKAGTKAAPTMEERLERVLARNTGSIWSKIGLLVAGAVCIVALLIAAEMIPLAVRVEQKLDYLQRSR